MEKEPLTYFLLSKGFSDSHCIILVPECTGTLNTSAVLTAFRDDMNQTVVILKISFLLVTTVKLFV